MSRSLLVVFPLALFLCATTATAEDAKEKAIQKDRDKIAGTWKITAMDINGNQAKQEDVQKLTVVNGADGTWAILSEGNEIAKGTSTFDPTQDPKQIDFTPTEGGGQGNQYHGIYELGDDTRKVCFASADKARPTEFNSAPGSGVILVFFERVKKE